MEMIRHYNYSHTNIAISHAGLPTRQDGVENRDKVYNSLQPLSWNLCQVRPLLHVEFLMSSEHRPILVEESTD